MSDAKSSNNDIDTESNIKIAADSSGRVVLQINDSSARPIVKLNISIDAVDDMIIEFQNARDIAKSVNIFTSSDCMVLKS